MNKAALGLILIPLVCGTAAAVRPFTVAKDVRVGTYNTRAIAVAFTASRFNPAIEKKKELDAANKAGDKSPKPKPNITDEALYNPIPSA